MTKDWFTREKMAAAAAFAWHWVVVAAVAGAAVLVIKSITGTTRPSLLGFALFLPVTGALMLLVILAGDRFRAASTRTQYRIRVGGWILACALLISSSTLNLARDTGVMAAVIFVGFMAALIYAFWEHFPGSAPPNDHGASHDDDEVDAHTPA